MTESFFALAKCFRRFSRRFDPMKSFEAGQSLAEKSHV
jgi:hypothetical protein